jgi:diphthine synthase
MGLVIAGLGLDCPNSVPIEVIEIAKKSDKILIEAYTSPLPNDKIAKLEVIIGKRFEKVSRERVEDGKQIIEYAKNLNVVLLCPGDPLVATTHQELRLRALQKGVKCKVIHSSSIIPAVIGEIGLHHYKLGKVVTMVSSSPLSSLTVYQTVFENMIRNLHSLILLEFVQEKDFELKPNDALKELMNREEERNLNVAKKDTFAIVASRVGQQNQSLIGGYCKDLSEMDFGNGPHSIVIPADLHFTEREALKAVLGLSDEKVKDNGLNLKRLADIIVKRYAQKTKKALQNARTKRLKVKGVGSLLENVECYTSDAERFINEGKYELGLVSIGYAEGLLDSLTYLLDYNPWE